MDKQQYISSHTLDQILPFLGRYYLAIFKQCTTIKALFFRLSKIPVDELILGVFSISVSIYFHIYVVSKPYNM